MKSVFVLFMVAALATVSQAVVIDSFVNADFDSGAASNPFKGFDAPDAPEIIGWTNYPGGPLADSGVQGPGAWWIPYETNSAFMKSGDAAYNISSYVIQTGDAFNVSFFGKLGWGGTGQWTVSLFYNDPNNVIGSFVADLSGWNPVSNAAPIVATAPSIGGTLGILFRSTGTGFSCLDELTVVTVPLANNSPANGATMIPVERTSAENDLVFTIYNPNVTKVDVQLGTENDPNLTTKPEYKIVNDMAVTLGQYTVNLQSLAADLLYGKTYYWKVIGYEPNAAPGATDFVAVPGPVWSFTTIPATPVFTVNPGKAGAFVGGSATLTATCSSLSSLTGPIQWFASPSNVEITTSDPDVTIVENTVGALTTSALTINNVTSARDGQYYAKATNTGGASESAKGTIIIKRLLAQYLFENNTNDSSPSGLHGTSKTPIGTPIDPNYAASVNTGMGQSLIFNGLGDSNITNTTGNYVDLPDGFSDFSQGLTISAWVYPTAVQNWGRIVEFGNGTNGGSNSFYFTRSASTTQIKFENDNTNPTSATSVIAGNDTLVNNVWQMLTVTLSTSATNNAVIYRNGVAVATGTITLPNVITRTNCFIGKSEWYGDSMYKGQMDDVRIYNYGLSNVEIAQLYTSQMPGIYICMSNSSSDFTADCRVSLADLLALAQNWLGCERIPAASCSW